MPAFIDLKSTPLRLLGLALVAVSPLAFAGEPVDTTATRNTGAPEIALELPTQWTTLPQRAVSSIGAPVDVARLATMRGGEDDHQSNIVVDGTVDGNSADRIVSGNNHVGSGAFDNANGINTVIQNSGTNVLIQNAMVVNVNFADPTP